MPSSKRHVVEALLYAAFIAFMVSGALVEKLRRLLPQQDHHRLREERWAGVFASAAVDLLALLLRRGRAATSAEPYIERGAKQSIPTKRGSVSLASLRLLCCNQEQRRNRLRMLL
jgi:hypothetical protein